MNKYREIFSLLVQTLILTFCTVFAVIPFSCRITEEGIRISNGDYIAPVMEAVNVLDEKTIVMSFSEKIKLRSVVISKMIEDISDSVVHSNSTEASMAIRASQGEFGRLEVDYEVSEDEKSIIYKLQEPCEPGINYEIFGVVEDKTGNSLSFCVPFCGYNSRVPQMIMTEVHHRYGSKSIQKVKYVVGEYIEFLVLSDGNLAGLEILSGADGDSKKYCFPPIEVYKGEILIVHLRKYDDTCVNEVGNDLDASTAYLSVNGCRDLWDENTLPRLNDNSDIILLRNGINGAIIDAFMYAIETEEEWKKGPLSLTQSIVAAGIYESANINDATQNSCSSALKSFNRIDAAEIKNKIMQNEDIKFPVKNSEKIWEVKETNPGTL